MVGSSVVVSFNGKMEVVEMQGYQQMVNNVLNSLNFDDIETRNEVQSQLSSMFNEGLTKTISSTRGKILNV